MTTTTSKTSSAYAHACPIIKPFHAAYILHMVTDIGPNPSRVGLFMIGYVDRFKSGRDVGRCGKPME
jgi:hypothetical protein